MWTNPFEKGIKFARKAASDSHTLFRPGDKSMDEATRHHVEVGGLCICKVCGAAEIELEERFCKKDSPAEGTERG